MERLGWVHQAPEHQPRESLKVGGKSKKVKEENEAIFMLVKSMFDSLVYATSKFRNSCIVTQHGESQHWGYSVMKVAPQQLSLDLKSQIHESQAFVESTYRISLTKFDSRYTSALKMSNKHMHLYHVCIYIYKSHIQSVNSTSNFLYTRSDSSGV